ncbi:MAG: hypothetical protein HOQ24_12080 [Mycobacteriaceae bacterium]|nr:hypothetical protein [Mycobacteriaceae bacterium]
MILAAVLLTSLTDRRDAGADRVIQAVQAFVAAHNGADEARKKETECAGGFDAGHSPFAGKPGRVGLISVTEPHVDGPRATARVTVEPEHGDRHTSVWRLIDTNGNWRVCTFS